MADEVKNVLSELINKEIEKNPEYAISEDYDDFIDFLKVIILKIRKNLDF